MTKSNQPRLPNHEEREQLIAWNCSMGVDRETAEGFIEGAAIAVFDDYITDCPVYAGKVMMVVWPAAPSIHDVFSWEHGTFCHEECERCVVEKRSLPNIVDRVA